MQLSHEQLISVDIETENISSNISSNIYVPANPNTLS